MDLTHCERMAEDGADIIALDIPAAADDLGSTAAMSRSTASGA
jgi:hypothetical protein